MFHLSSTVPSSAARRLRLKTQVVLLAFSLALAAAAPASAADAPASAKETKTQTVLTGVVNLNAASAEELRLLPGVGEKKAQAIIDARKTRGGFRSVDELTEVKGIGEAMLARLRPHVSLDGKTTAVLQ